MSYGVVESTAAQLFAEFAEFLANLVVILLTTPEYTLPLLPSISPVIFPRVKLCPTLLGTMVHRYVISSSIKKTHRMA